MSFSQDVLANIKTSVDSDCEEEYIKSDGEDEQELDHGGDAASLLEVMLGNYVSEEEAAAGAEDDGPDAVGEGDVVNAAEDPLEEVLEMPPTKKLKFMEEYDDEELLNDDLLPLGQEGEEEMHQKPTTSKKRGRPAATPMELRGRNGQIWSTVPKDEATLSAAPVPLLPCGKGPARSVSNPLEAWHLLMDEPILQLIVKHTNEAIKRNRRKEPIYRPTDLIELRAWLGLNYLCGLFRNSPQPGPLEELWTLELGNAIFRATMPLKRYEFLAESLHLAELGAKSLEPVRLVWEKFIINCRSYYAPSGSCTLDEHILTLGDEACPHQYTLPGNSMERGLRLVTLCDAKTLYLSNAIIATQTTPHDRDVLHLVSDIKGTQRSVTVNERYCSLSLASKLAKCQLALVGSVPQTCRDIPLELLSSRGQRKLYAEPAVSLTSTFDPSLCSTHFLLSSGLSPQINAEKLHRFTRDSCQRQHQMAASYNTIFATPPALLMQSTRGRPIWPLKFLHAMLNFSGLNAWTLLRLSDKGDATLLHRDFLRQLGLYLTQQQLRRRLKRPERLSLAQKLQICEILGDPMDKFLCEATANAALSAGQGVIDPTKSQLPEGVVLVEKMNEKRKRCRKCPSHNGNKTRNRCQQCMTPLCMRHLIMRCDKCTGVVDTESGEKDPFFQ